MLVFAWGIQLVMRRGRLEAAGRERVLLLLIGVAVVSTIVNFDSLSAAADESPVNPVLYFISFLLLFALVASTIDRLPNVEQILRVLVLGGTVVALFAIYEARTRYNFFDHLGEFVPILDRQEREVLELRGGRLRVHASSQHPIAFGVALIMILPIAIYLAKRASTTARTRLWFVAALLCATAVVTTVSRTTVLMALAMGVVALRLRGGAIVRYWPALLILPSRSTSSRPARSAGSQVVLPQGGAARRRAGPGRRVRIGPLRRHRARPEDLARVTRRRPRARQHDRVPARGDPPRTGADRAGDLRQPVHGTLVQLGVVGLIGAFVLIWGSALA